MCPRISQEAGTGAECREGTLGNEISGVMEDKTTWTLWTIQRILAFTEERQAIERFRTEE